LIFFNHHRNRCFFSVPAGIMFFIMAGGFYIASLLIKDGTSDFKSSLARMDGMPGGDGDGWERLW
jgi:hypothetical protein